jgi:hypothetical protein
MNRIHAQAEILRKGIERYEDKKANEVVTSFREDVRAARRQKAYDTAMDFIVEFCKCSDCKSIRREFGF